MVASSRGQALLGRVTFLDELKNNRGLKVVFLGTGGPDIDPWDIRGGPCEIVVIDEEAILIDCGPFAVERMIQGPIKPWTIDHLFLTHSYHYDHFASYPTFLFVRCENTAKPLKVFGPKKTLRRHDLMLNELWDDDPRAQRVLSKKQVTVKDIDDGLVCEGSNWKAYCTHVEHGEAVGYRFDTPYGSIGITGDIRFNREGSRYEPFINMVKGVDLFIVDCDVKHSKPESIGEACRDSDAKMVALTHFHNPEWRRGRKDRYTGLRNVVKSIYQGKVVMASDLKEIELA